MGLLLSRNVSKRLIPNECSKHSLPVFETGCQRIDFSENHFVGKEKEIRKWESQFQNSRKAGNDWVEFKDLIEIKEVVSNPMGPRMCELFSEDGSGKLDIRKFKNMMAMFSRNMNPEIKAAWIFALWDFDGDAVIGPCDFNFGIKLILGISEESDEIVEDLLTKEELKDLLELFITENHSQGISYLDFSKIISQNPKFWENFHFNI